MRFSPRYFIVELLTGLGFAGLFYLEVVVNIHDWFDPTPWASLRGIYCCHFWAGFAYHAILFSLLMAASMTDLNGREIPLPLTITGTIIGVIGGTLMPWPWPWTTAQFPVGAAPPPIFGVPPGMEWIAPTAIIREGIQPWPFWGPLPGPFAPGGNWQTGLATSLVGMLVGTFLFRALGAVFSAGLGKESLGLGDADLMMMVGSFVGWQIVVISLFVAVIPAAIFGVLLLVLYRDNSLPFGPSLAAGSLLTLFCWRWLPGELRMLFFWWPALLGMTLFAGVFLFVCSRVIRTAQRK
jgi:leader peptidase (prepilin peptidase)/N-methyltransferase